MPDSKQPDGSQPPKKEEQETIITDLSNGKSDSNQRAPSSASIMTQVMGSGQPRPHDQTVSTDLHVPGGGDPPRKVSSGTHQHQIWGDFELGDLLGRGGMGSVYRGRQISLDRSVAIKVLPSHLSENENFRSRFQLEARAVAKISSPHVVGVFFAGVHEGHHYFAMEYVEGRDLAARLKEGFKPTQKQALDLVTQAVRGLVAAGELDIVHRDIKPGNMMVTDKGVLKLMDFGLVRLSSNADTGLTMAGTVMGTVSYFSPEQGRGERCDCRTDIYAIGIVFYELLTGQLPFTAGDATSVIYQHIHQEPKPPKEIDPSISEYYQAVVLKCLQKNPDDRYQTAKDLLKDLEALALGIEPTTAFHDLKALRVGGTLTREKTFQAERKKRMQLVAVLLLLLVAGGGAGGYYWWQEQQRQQITTPTATIAKPAPMPSPTPMPPQPETPTKPVVDIEQARALLTANDYSAAKVAITQALANEPQSESWLALQKDVQTAELTSHITAGDEALKNGEIEAARTALNAALAVSPDNAEVLALRGRIEQVETAQKERAKILHEAETLLAEGNGSKAESVLAPLVEANPDDQVLNAMMRRARKLAEDQAAREKAVTERLAQGEEALARKDLDAALLHFTAAQQLDPKNSRATAGLSIVTTAKSNLAKQREAFEQALKAKDLAAAEAAVASMRQIAPGSPSLVLAENELNNSRLAQENKAKAQAERDAAIADAATRLGTLIDDPSQQLAELSRAVDAFAKENGEAVVEKAGLRTKLEDRQHREAVQQQLVTLDVAVLNKKPADIASVVTNAEYVKALTELSTMAGLEFSSQLTDFTRTGDSAKATVQITHALTTFPKRVLTMQYALARSAKGWTITAAELQ